MVLVGIDWEALAQNDRLPKSTVAKALIASSAITVAGSTPYSSLSFAILGRMFGSFLKAYPFTIRAPFCTRVWSHTSASARDRNGLFPCETRATY